jgi:beta-glucosidase
VKIPLALHPSFTLAALVATSLAACERATPQTTPATVVGMPTASSPPSPAAAPTPASQSANSIACIAPKSPSVEFYGGADFPSASCRARANELIAKMTPREKAAQMIQLARDQVARPEDIEALSLGSVLSGGGMGPWGQNSPGNWATMVNDYHRASRKTRLGIPILYGVDAVHGHSNVRGAVIFPHNIGLGASRDADLVERVSRATAEEVAATGADWTFAPVVAAVRDERWGRTYEGFGETTELAESLGPAAVRGFQGAALGKGPASILACAKHFIGDGATKGGVDRGDDDLDESEIRTLLLPPYARAIQAKVGSIMVSYSSVRGVRMHCSGHLLTDILKRELGFNGFLVSDWEAIEQIRATYDQSLAAAVNAGVDMIMHPAAAAHAIDALAALVPDRVSAERVDDAARRILSIKCELGLLDRTKFDEGSGEQAQLLREVGSDAHRKVAREAVQKSLVLLKNERGVLPLSKGAKSLLVTGRSADNLGFQCGGWTIDWQGGSGSVTTGTTILEGMKRAVSPKTKVMTERDPRVAPNAAVVVIGEPPYAEMRGDRRDLALDPQDIEAVKSAKSTGAPVVVLLVTGRPLILAPILDLADAIAVAWLPGTEGAGIADVLFGDVAPTAKLPHTWPKSMQDIPLSAADTTKTPLFPYGFGLTYAKRTASR